MYVQRLEPLALGEVEHHHGRNRVSGIDLVEEHLSVIVGVVGRSQPEIARLLRFIPTSERGRRLAARRTSVIAAATAAGFSDVRVFGSVARGDDGPDSDVDLLVALPEKATLFDLARLEAELSELLNEEVDVVPDSHLKPHLREGVLSESVPL